MEEDVNPVGVKIPAIFGLVWQVGVLVYERLGEMSLFFSHKLSPGSPFLPRLMAWLDLLQPASTWHWEFTQESSDSLSSLAEVKKGF